MAANKLKIIYRGQEISGVLMRFDLGTDALHYYFYGDLHIEIPRSESNKVETLIKSFGTSKINKCKFPVIDYDKGSVSLNNVPSDAEREKTKKDGEFKKTITPVVNS